MAEMMRKFGFNHEAMSLVFGVVALLASVLFFLQRFDIYTLTIIENFTDAQYLYFFAGFTFLAGVVMLMTTLGFIGSN